MAVRTKVRSGVRPKRPALPFVAPEEHYATKEDTAKIETKIANLRTELKTDIARLEGKLAGMKLFLGFNTALLLAIMAKLFLS